MIHKALVWYCREYRLWGITFYDEEGNSIGDTDWCSGKAQAKAQAKSMQSNGHLAVVEVA